MVRMIEPVSSTLSSSSNSIGDVSQIMRTLLCDHLEIVILSFDQRWLLKNMQGAPDVKPCPALDVPPSPLENGEERVQRISKGPFMVNVF